MFPVYSRLQTFWGETGQLLAGGELRFFVPDTTTPKDVYADPEDEDTNGSVVSLDASGRANEGVWGDGDYFVALYDSAGVKQGEDTVLQPGGAAVSIPIPNEGEVLTGDGAIFQVMNLLSRLIPDPTGQSGKYLGSDGSGPVWQTGPQTPELPDLPVDSGTGYFFVGDTLIRYGTGTVPANGSGNDSSTTISFPSDDEAFSSAPKVYPVINKSTICAAGLVGTIAITGSTTSGFTVKVHSGDNDNQSEFRIIADVPSYWGAIGPRA